MSESTFKTCPACNNSIGLNDNVAVCEKCGSTYHAECYEKNGCVNAQCNGKEAPAVNPVVVTNTCNKCGATLTNGQRFCPTCGNDTCASNVRICKSCGTELISGTDFCAKCGRKYDAAPEAAKKKSNKGVVIGIIVAIIAVLGIAAAAVLFILLRPIPVDAIVMDNKDVELVEGECIMLEYSVYPENAKLKLIEWATSDDKIAEIDVNGKLEAVAAGECTITLIIDGVEAEVEVVVKKDLPDFNEIYDEYCSSTWASVGSDSSYLEIDTNPYNYDDYSISAARTAIEKVNSALGLPDSLYRDMQNTSWSMGKQSETYESIGIKVEWTYHPDKGMEVAYKYINN